MNLNSVEFPGLCFWEGKGSQKLICLSKIVVVTFNFTILFSIYVKNGNGKLIDIILNLSIVLMSWIFCNINYYNTWTRMSYFCVCVLLLLSLLFRFWHIEDSVIGNSMDKPTGHYVKWKKPETEREKNSYTVASV